MSQGPKLLERRWIILAQDGRHVTVGRAAPPSEAEVEAAAQDIAGWLATLDWPAAIIAFEAAHQRALRPL